MPAGIINWNAFSVEFFKEGFEQLIDVHGTRFLWERATWCPNFIDNDTDQHSIDCPTCGDANGILYYGPQKPIKVIMQSVGLEQVFRGEGRFDLGTAILTTPSDIDLRHWDKLTVRDAISRYRQIIKRNSVNLIDKTRYSIEKINTLQNPEQEFIEGQHFKINDDKNIEWLSDTLAPTDGDIFTIDYDTHPIFLIMEMPNELRDQLDRQHPLGTVETFKHLPKKVLAKRDFLVRDESDDVRE